MVSKIIVKPINKVLIAISVILGLQLSVAQAQEIKGFVYELVSSNPLWNTAIKNLRTQEIVQSNRDGSFKIGGQVNDYLEFTNPGYKRDTIFYYENNIRRVYMTRDESLISIDEVVVSRMTDSRLAAEISKAQNEGKAVDVGQERGGLRVSPSRLFGKKAKEARSNLSLLIAEKNKREVDRRFTTQLIASITPLSLEEIALFRERFRPTLDFINKATNEDLNIYILDAYKDFKGNKQFTKMTSKLHVTLAILICSITMVNAQKVDRKLEKTIQQEIKDFRGEIGIYVHHLKTDKIVAINADTIFPTASIIKVPLLVGVFQELKNGNLSLDQPFRYSDKRAYGGSGLMQFYKDSAQTDLSTMISLMLTYSDNVTSIWLQELAGGGAKINPQMDQLGLVHTKVNSKTVGREKIWEKYGWGQTTPQEMAKLFTLIRDGKVIDEQYSDKMYRYLKNQFYNGRSLSQIPAWVNTISKTGSVDEARGEVVLVNAPSGDYVFCILTKNNQDTSWTDANEAEVLTKKLSAIIWNHFEPKHPFKSFNPIK